MHYLLVGASFADFFWDPTGNRLILSFFLVEKYYARYRLEKARSEELDTFTRQTEGGRLV
jgi:hypothetical protein